MVTVLALLGVLAVLFVAAVLATSDRPVLAEAPPDTADLPLPEEPLTPDDVARLRFSMTARGYRMSQVDEVLARLADELADRDRRIALLEAAAEGSAPAVPAVEEPAVRAATVEDLPVAPAVPSPAAPPSAPPTVVPPAPAAPVAPAPVPLADPPPAAPADAPVPAPTPAPDDATQNATDDAPDDPDADPLPPADLGTELLTEERLEQPQPSQRPAPADDDPRPSRPV